MASNEVVEMMVEEGQSGGVHRAPDDSPQLITQQSWKNSYVDPTRQPIHILIYDMINGVGGVAGNIDTDNDGNDGTYSYVDPMSTELQWRNRVKQTKFYNYAQRTYASMVNPVFSEGNITTLVSFNGDGKEDELVQQWEKNCDGTGTSYEAMQKLSLMNLRAHDVAYYAMTKTDGSDIPSLSVYRAVDVISATGTDDGILDDITFFRGNKSEQDSKGKITTYTYAIQFFMRGGMCHVQMWRAENDEKHTGSLGNWNDLEFEKFVEERPTEVSEMVVKGHLPIASPIGEFVPTTPTSKTIIDACLGIFQDESKMNWLFALHNLPTPVIWGSNIKGILGGAGQSIVQETNDPSQGFAPKPDYMSVNPALLSGSMDKLKFNLERLRELAKENGVDTVTGAQAQSGDSKRYEFQATEQKLRGSVDLLEQMDEWVFHMFNIYTSRSDAYTYARTYPISFYPEEEATLTDLAEGVSVANEFNYPATRNILMLKYTRQLMGKGLSKEDELVVIDEIEKGIIEKTNNGE